MTKKEAIMLADKHNELLPTEFCPLIKDKCRIDCVCWNFAKPLMLSGEKYIVEGGHCGMSFLKSSTLVDFSIKKAHDPSSYLTGKE